VFPMEVMLILSRV